MLRRNTIAAFTLIELMIVIAIIGILMAYAFPVYRDYMVKSRRGECNSLSDNLKTLMVDYYTANNNYPTNLSSLGISGISGANVSATVLGKTITCTPLSVKAGINVITWTVTLSGSVFNWSCNDSGLVRQDICP